MTRSADPARQDGWEAHRLAELEGRLRSTHSQRLRWLEEAIEFAWLAGALPRKDDVRTRSRDPLSGERDP
jgi:hypothetical protein